MRFLEHASWVFVRPSSNMNGIKRLPTVIPFLKPKTFRPLVTIQNRNSCFNRYEDKKVGSKCRISNHFIFPNVSKTFSSDIPTDCDNLSQLTIGPSTLSDKPEMVQILLDSFTIDEASHGSLAKQGIHSIQDFRNTFIELVDKVCGNNYTVVAKYGPKVIGVILSWATTAEEYFETPEMRHIQQVKVFIQKCHEKRTEKLPDGKFIYISYAGIHADYRNSGIGGKMADVLLSKVKQEKCWPAVFVECTSLYSQAGMAKEGFKVIAELKYEDYTDENGELIFKHTEPHKSTQLMLLKLE